MDLLRVDALAALADAAPVTESDAAELLHRWAVTAIDSDADRAQVGAVAAEVLKSYVRTLERARVADGMDERRAIVLRMRALSPTSRGGLRPWFVAFRRLAGDPDPDGSIATARILGEEPQ